MSNVIGKCNIVGDTLMIWCPACKTAHGINTKRWHFDGNHQHPTIRPSLLSQIGTVKCHSFVTKGQFEYLADCSHELANKNVPIPDWPYADTPEVPNA